MLIALYVQNQWSFDEFHAKSDRIYRAWVEETTGDGRQILNTATPVPLKSALIENIPEVEYSTYLYNFNNLVQPEGDSQALNESILVTDADFFRMFDFELQKGQQSTVFANPQSVVLTEEIAQRFFGTVDPMQQTLQIRLGSEFKSFTVTGIIEKAPSNSSLQYQILIPDENLEELLAERNRRSWFNVFGSTYVVLQAGADPAGLKEKTARMMQGILGDEVYNQTDYTIGVLPISTSAIILWIPMVLSLPRAATLILTWPAIRRKLLS